MNMTGPFVAVRLAKLIDGKVLAEPLHSGTRAECESVIADEPTMDWIPPERIAEERWSVFEIQKLVATGIDTSIQAIDPAFYGRRN